MERFYDGLSTRELAAKMRWYVERYNTPPYGREIVGTDELLEKAAEALDRLAAYEDTGSIDHLCELVQAERDGRLVVFPKDAKQTSTPDDYLVTIVKPGGDMAVKPCPFCGGSDIVYWEYRRPAGLRWRIACLTCMAMIDPGWIQQHDYLTDLWNKRSDGPDEAEAATMKRGTT